MSKADNDRRIAEATEEYAQRVATHREVEINDLLYIRKDRIIEVLTTKRDAVVSRMPSQGEAGYRVRNELRLSLEDVIERLKLERDQ